MIFYLNRGLILEQEVVKAIRVYLAACGAQDYYKKIKINVTNQHPFARLMLDALNGKKTETSLFPAIVVSTTDEGDVPGLEPLNDDQSVKLEPDDIPLLQKRYSMLTDRKIAEITAAMEAHGGELYGYCTGIRRHENISVEIWAENIQLKNELYELSRLFIAGGMGDYLGGLYDEYGLTIFDDTVRGQRSNNFNEDFGVILAGGQITFGADYLLEQTVIDTELVDGKIDIMEVINHVRDYEEQTRSVVFDHSADGGTGEGSGSA